MKNEHAVIVKFDYGSTDLSMLFDLEDELEEALRDTGIEYDGHEIAVDGSDGLLFLYGPNADEILDKIKDRLISCKNISDVTATLRYGPSEADIRQSSVRIK